MQKLMRRLAGAVVLVGLVGCAAQRPILNAENRAKLGTTDVVAQVKQEEIYAQIERSQAAMYGGGGLILALIDAAVDNSRAKSAEKAVEPYRNALVDYNFAAHLEAELQKSLSGPGFPVQSLKLQRGTGAKTAAVTDIASGASLLRIESSYYFTPDFSAVVVAGDAVLSITQNGKRMVVHDQTYFISKAAPTGAQSMQEKWTANNGAALRAALDQGIVDLVSRMHAQLIAPSVQAQN